MEEQTWWILGGILIELVMGVYCLWRIRKEHQVKETRSAGTMLSVWALFVLHSALIGYASWRPIFLLPMSEIASLLLGGLGIAFGTAFAVAGFAEFRSLRRMSGREADRLITSGVYRWSRNPQNVGWGALLVGVALAGRSTIALVLAASFWLIFRIYVVLEERHLEWVFGDEWRRYQATTARFLGATHERQEMPAEGSSPLFSSNSPPPG